MLSGCNGSSTTTDQSSPLLSDQSGPDGGEVYDAGSSERLLIDRVIDGSFEALIAMNEVHSRGELISPYLNCVDSTGGIPLIVYDCSAAAVSTTLQEFGYPVSQLELVDDPFCREQLASSQDSLGCVFKTLNVDFADNWKFKTQYGVFGDSVRVQVQLFQGDATPLLDLSSFSTACDLTLIPEQSTVRNDEQLCRQATQELLAQTDQL